MSASPLTDFSGYVPVTEAAELLGVTVRTLANRRRRNRLDVLVDPRDLRRRLIRVGDLAAFAQPRVAPLAPTGAERGSNPT